MRCSKAQNLIPLLEMGLIDDPHEKALLEEHLAACPECARLHSQHRKLSSELTAELSALDPPPRGSFLKARNLIQAETRRVEYRRRYSFWNALRRRSRPVAALGAFALLIAMFLGQPVVYSQPVGTSITFPLDAEKAADVDLARVNSILPTFPELKNPEVTWELRRAGDTLRLTIDGDDGGLAPRVSSRLAFIVPQIERRQAEYRTVVNNALASRFDLYTGRTDKRGAEKQKALLEAQLASLPAWEMEKLPKVQMALRNSYADKIIAAGWDPEFIFNEENRTRVVWQDGSQVFISTEGDDASVKATFASAGGFDHGLFGGVRKPYEALILDKELDRALEDPRYIELAENTLLIRADQMDIGNCDLDLSVHRPVGTMRMQMERGDLKARSASVAGTGFDLNLGFEPLHEDAFMSFLRSVPQYKVRVEKNDSYPDLLTSLVEQREMNQLVRGETDPRKLTATIEKRLQAAGIGANFAASLRGTTEDGHYEIRIYDGKAEVVSFPALKTSRHAPQVTQLRLFGDSGDCRVFCLTENNQSPPPFSYVGPVDSWEELARLPFGDPQGMQAASASGIYRRAESVHNMASEWSVPVEHLQEIEESLGRIVMIMPGLEQIKRVEVTPTGIHSQSENSLDKALRLIGGEHTWTYSRNNWLAWSEPEDWTIRIDPDVWITNGHRKAKILQARDIVMLRDSSVEGNVVPGLTERIDRVLKDALCEPDGLAIVFARQEALPLVLTIDGGSARFATLDEDLLLAEAAE